MHLAVNMAATKSGEMENEPSTITQDTRLVVHLSTSGLLASWIGLSANNPHALDKKEYRCYVGKEEGIITPNN